jgi:hypothetical protein
MKADKRPEETKCKEQSIACPAVSPEHGYGLQMDAELGRLPFAIVLL